VYRTNPLFVSKEECALKKRDTRDFLTFLGFILPGFIIYIFIVAYPIFYSILLSFSDYNPNIGGKWNFMGLTHYKTMLTDPDFWHAFKNNMIVVAVSSFGQIPIGFILAFILYRKQVKGANFFQSMVFLPQFLSMIVIGIMWRMLFMVDGPVARLMQSFSNDPTKQFTMMLSPKTAMIPVGIALIWVYTGFYMIIFLANLQKINDSMIEAAKIDGASEPQIFVKIIVPLLAGTILTSTILAIAGSLKGFNLIFAITTEGITRLNAEVLPLLMYRTAFQDYSNPMRFAYGATISNTVVLISILMILLSNFIGKKLGTHEEY
jgi:raffinose/stachyose/melibiose transport system permease protein